MYPHGYYNYIYEINNNKKNVTMIQANNTIKINQIVLIVTKQNRIRIKKDEMAFNRDFGGLLIEMLSVPLKVG